MKKVTFEDLSKIISNEVFLITKDDGEVVEAITCDKDGVLCDSEYGATSYDYDEVEYQEDK